MSLLCARLHLHLHQTLSEASGCSLLKVTAGAADMLRRQRQREADRAAANGVSTSRPPTPRSRCSSGNPQGQWRLSSVKGLDSCSADNATLQLAALCLHITSLLDARDEQTAILVCANMRSTYSQTAAPFSLLNTACFEGYQPQPACAPHPSGHVIYFAPGPRWQRAFPQPGRWRSASRRRRRPRRPLRGLRWAPQLQPVLRYRSERTATPR